MTKKKRISEDAFSWVQDTTEKPEEPKPAEEAPPKKKKSGAVPESTRQRAIFVEYVKKDGRIVATHEIFRETDETTPHPWTTIPKDRAAARIVLSGELLDKGLIYIHQNYKVVISNKKPTLVPKE
jgi:hypothetical protein